MGIFFKDDPTITTQKKIINLINLVLVTILLIMIFYIDKFTTDEFTGVFISSLLLLIGAEALFKKEIIFSICYGTAILLLIYVFL